jgi:hypothetical protein
MCQMFGCRWKWVALPHKVSNRALLVYVTFSEEAPLVERTLKKEPLLALVNGTACKKSNPYFGWGSFNLHSGNAFTKPDEISDNQESNHAHVLSLWEDNCLSSGVWRYCLVAEAAARKIC